MATARGWNSPTMPPEQSAYLDLLRASATLSHRADLFFREFGITQPQFNVLRILRGAGPEGLCRNAIADRMTAATPDMSRMLERMEQTGWIARERSAQDRRQVSTVITPAGLRLLARIDGPLKEHHRSQFPGWTGKDLERLLTLLKRLQQG